MELHELVEKNLIPFPRLTVSDALKDAEQFRFDKQQPNRATAVCLYGSILEMAYSSIALLEKKEMTPIPIVLRAFLEAYADLRACVDDPGYYKNMYASFLDEKLRFFEALERNPTNQYLQGAHGQLDVQAETKSLESELEQYKKENRKPLRNWQRFKYGKLEDEYQSMYWLLCLHGHNNLSALEDRHIEKVGNDYNVVLFKDESAEALQRYLDTVISIVIESTVMIHKFLNISVATRHEAHQKKLAELRKEYVY